jgi:hypothetical protein
LRITMTGQGACRTTESETLPIRVLLIPPRPRLPTTTSPAPSSSANQTIAASGRPNMRCASAVFAPSPRMCSACSSTHVRAWRLACSKPASQPSHISGPKWGLLRSSCMAYTTCSSEPVALATSVAARAAAEASFEPSMATRILPGRFPGSCASP